MRRIFQGHQPSSQFHFLEKTTIGGVNILDQGEEKDNDREETKVQISAFLSV